VLTHRKSSDNYKRCNEWVS